MVNRFWWIALFVATIMGLGPARFVRAQDKAVVAIAASVPVKTVAPGGSTNLALALTIDHEYHINSNPASDEYLIPVEAKVAPVTGIATGKPVYPKGVMRKFAFSPKPVSVYEGKVTITVPLRIAANAKPGARTVQGTVRYQACNDNSCLIPTEVPFKVSLTVGGKGSADAGGAGAGVSDSTGASGGNGGTDGGSSVTAGPTDASAGTPVEASSAEASAASASAAAFAQAEKLRAKYGVKGLPSIVFVDAKGVERADLRAGEELTLNGMQSKLTALATGTTTDADRAGGAQSWAERLQNSALWLQLLLAFGGGLLLNLTPCVYPMIPITVGYFGAQSEGRIGKTFGLAALYVLGLSLVYSALGVTAALTGTLFGSALQSPWVTGAVAVVLAVLGLGMLGLFTIQPPSFILSKSGAKKGGAGALAMGALLGIVAAPCVGPVVAALLTYVGSKGSPLLGFALFFALSLGLGVPYLLLGAFSGSLKSLPRSGVWLERSKKIFSVPIMLAAVFYFYTAYNALAVPAVPEGGDRWALATTDRLEAAQAAGRPIVLDFRADWCLPCRKLEHEIFSRPELLEAAKQQNIELLQVDLTRANA